TNTTPNNTIAPKVVTPGPQPPMRIINNNPPSPFPVVANPLIYDRWLPRNGWNGSAGSQGWRLPTITGGGPNPYFAMNWPAFAYPFGGGFRASPYWPGYYYPYYPGMPGLGYPTTPSSGNDSPFPSTADESELVLKV